MRDRLGGLAGLVALILAGCATQPVEPVPPPAAIEIVPVTAPALPPPVDTPIRETAIRMVEPVIVRESGGETTAYLIDFRPAGPRCVVVNGGASCDWGAK